MRFSSFCVGFQLFVSSMPFTAALIPWGGGTSWSKPPWGGSAPGPQSPPPHGQWGNSTYCCSCLSAELGGMVSYAGQAIYSQEQNGTQLQGYWSAQEAELYPACRVTPACANDVAVAVQILGHHMCKFAVRGGGHTAWPGAANIGEEGVTIDLSALNGVTVSTDNSTAGVGGGSRWYDVYTQLNPLGLAVSGGRVAGPGVGGLTLGGGKSFFGAKYGFACDGVVNFELVTAMGDILDVNATSNANLFKALKGGNNNFGIVTRFDLQTFEYNGLWGGFIYYPDSTLKQQLEYLYYYVEAAGDVYNPPGDSEIIFSWDIGSSGRAIANFYTNTLPEANPALLQNFTSLQPQLFDGTSFSNQTALADQLNAGTPDGNRYLFATATFGNDVDLFIEIAAFFNKTVEPFIAANYSNLEFSFVLQPLTKAQLAPGCDKNSLGLCPSNGNLVILDLTFQWTTPLIDTHISDAAKRIVAKADSLAKQKGKYSAYRYLNYALPEQNPIAQYGRQNVANMIAMSREYDPQQVFQRLVGGYKLPGGF